MSKINRFLFKNLQKTLSQLDRENPDPKLSQTPEK
jgi:hypothetical protein